MRLAASTRTGQLSKTERRGLLSFTRAPFRTPPPHRSLLPPTPSSPLHTATSIQPGEILPLVVSRPDPATAGVNDAPAAGLVTTPEATPPPHRWQCARLVARHPDDIGAPSDIVRVYVDSAQLLLERGARIDVVDVCAWRESIPASERFSHLPFHSPSSCSPLLLGATTQAASIALHSPPR